MNTPVPERYDSHLFHVPDEADLTAQLTERYGDEEFSCRIAPVLRDLLVTTDSKSVKRAVKWYRGDLFRRRKVNDSILDLLSEAIEIEERQNGER